MKYIDVHCHIDQYERSELAEIFKIGKDKSQQVIGAAINKASGQKLLSLKEMYPELEICLGIHPEYPANFTELASVKQQIIANRDKIIAIGEIGLPYYTLENLSEKEQAACLESGKKLLVEFLDLAEALKLPVVLHAIKHTTQIALQEVEKRKLAKVLFHWYEGEPKVMKEIVRQGYYISVSPDVLYNATYAEFVEQIPLENLVLESDGPWKYNGQKGVPAMMTELIAFLSIARNLEQEELKKIIYQNSCNLFSKEL